MENISKFKKMVIEPNIRITGGLNAPTVSEYKCETCTPTCSDTMTTFYSDSGEIVRVCTSWNCQ